MDSTVRVIFLGDAASAVRSVSTLEGRMGGLGATAARTGKIVAGAIGISIAGSLIKATSLAIGFDKSMRNVNSIAKLNEKQFQALSKQVLALGKVSGQAPKVLADGLYDVVSSGFKAADALKILHATSIAATAGQTDVATASKGVVAVLNAYGLGANKARNVSSLLFKEVQLGVNTFGDLASQIGDTAPLAAALKIPFSDVAAGLALITLHGTPVNEASTQMARVMTDLLKPSKALSAQLHSLGYENGQAAIQAHGFVPLIKQLSDSAGSSAVKTADWFQNIRSLRGMLNLTGPNLKKFNDFAKQMADSMRKGGDDTKAFNEQSKSIAVQWSKATAALSAGAITLGTQLFPVLIKGIGYLSTFADWFSKLAGKHTIQAKLEFAGQGALGLAKSVEDMLFGGQKQIEVPAVLAFNKRQGGTGLAPTQGIVAEISKSIQTGIDNADWSQLGQSISKQIGDATARQAHSHDWGSVAKAVTDGIPNAFSQVQEEGTRDIARQVGRMISAGVQGAIHLSRADIETALKGLGKAMVLSLEAMVGGSFGVAAGLIEGATGTRFTGSIRDLVAKVPGAVLSGLKGAYNAAVSLAERIVAGIKTAPQLLVGLAGDLGGYIKSALSQAGKDAYGWAIGVGEQIALGVLAGLKGLPGKILSAITPGGGGKPSPGGAKGGIGGSNPKLATHAQGGVIDRPMLSMIGEDAPAWSEFVIPTKPQHRQRALGLLAQASSALGVPGFAAGGGPHPLRKPKAVSIKSVTGAAATAIAQLTAAQARVADLGRRYDQDAREQGTVDLPPLTVDVPDDPADPNGSTHQMLNPPGITARVAQLQALVGEKGNIMAALEVERQRIADAITKVQAAIDALLDAIKKLNDKAKAEGVSARREHAAAATSSASVSRKGGLQDQVAAERAAKKPNKAKIAKLEAAIKQAGRDHDSHESSAKQHETYQGRYQQQAQTDAGKVSDLRGTLTGLLGNQHDLPFDVTDQQIDVDDLNQQIRAVQATSVSPFSPGTTTTNTATSTGGGSSITDAIASDMAARLAVYASALGLQGRQLGVLGGFPSFQRGSIQVPHTGLALLHAGEGVRTVDQNASDLRSQGSGYGPIHITLSGDLALAERVEAIVVDNPRVTASINGQIGRSADLLRRSNRLT